MNTLFGIWHFIQAQLFPKFEENNGPLTEKEKKFIEILSLLNLEKHIHEYSWKGTGRKRKNRLNIARAFVAKMLYNFETTNLLIDHLNGSKNLRRLCGWADPFEIPHPSTFSRAFDEFSMGCLPQKVHEAMIENHYGDKIVGHISRDSTAIEAREKPVKKNTQEPHQPKRKRGRPRKGEVVPPKPPKRLDLQLKRSLEENLEELPTQCDVGTKKNSKGYKVSWTGYKFHIDSIDGDIPISTILTSASLHDSQAAIVLAQISNQRVTNLYDLMDSAYDAPQIHNFCEQLGHRPIIDHNPRRGEKKHMDPATKTRYGERSGVERVNSNLKDNYGGRNIRVKGPEKVVAHLMFGIIALTAVQLFRLIA